MKKQICKSKKSKAKQRKAKINLLYLLFPAETQKAKKANLQLLFQLSIVRNGQRIVKDSQRLRCGNQAKKSKKSCWNHLDLGGQGIPCALVSQENSYIIGAGERKASKSRFLRTFPDGILRFVLLAAKSKKH